MVPEKTLYVPPVRVVDVVKFVSGAVTISELPLLAWNVPLFVAPAALIVRALALIGEDRALRLIYQRQPVDADLAGALDRVIHVGEGRTAGRLGRSGWW